MYHPSLDALIAVAESGSFNKAADRLYVSSTAVIKQITSLEKRIGLTLVQRTHRGVVLTAAGKSLYEDACYMVRTSAQAIERARHTGSGQPHTVRIGSSQLYPVSCAIALWDTVCAKLPDLTVSVIPFQESTSGEYINQIGRQYDLIYSATDFMDEKTSNTGCQVIETDHTSFCVAVSKDHPLAGKSQLSLEDLGGYTIMMMRSGFSPINDQIRNRITRHFPEIKLKTIENYYTLEQFNHCAENKGLMLSLDIWKNIHPGLVHIPLDVPEIMPCGFVCSAHPSPETQEFLDAINLVFKR